MDSADAGGSIRKCVSDPNIPEECRVLRQIYFECRRGQLVRNFVEYMKIEHNQNLLCGSGYEKSDPRKSMGRRRLRPRSEQEVVISVAYPYLRNEWHIDFNLPDTTFMSLMSANIRDSIPHLLDEQFRRPCSNALHHR